MRTDPLADVIQRAATIPEYKAALTAVAVRAHIAAALDAEEARPSTCTEYGQMTKRATLRRLRAALLGTGEAT